MKIWEEEEFLNIRNISLFFILYSWAYNFAFSEFYSWKKLHVLYKCTLQFQKNLGVCLKPHDRSDDLYNSLDLNNLN